MLVETKTYDSPTPITCKCDLNHEGKHLETFLPDNFKIHQGMTMLRGGTKKIQKCLPLTSTRGLNFGDVDLNFAHCTSSYQGEHFCLIILESIKE